VKAYRKSFLNALGGPLLLPEPLATDTELKIIEESGLPDPSSKTTISVTLPYVNSGNLPKDKASKTSPKKERQLKNGKKKKTAGVSIEASDSPRDDGKTEKKKIKYDSESDEKPKPNSKEQILKNSLAEAQKQ
jgi:hypothetical protein